MVSLRTAHLHILLIFTVLILLRYTKAAFNVTVDDEYGDELTGALPTYTPAGVWNLGTTCLLCSIKPDPVQAFNGTWHDSTRSPDSGSFNIQINFRGTAVYAYFILPNYIEGVSIKTNVSFLIDWNVVGSFQHDPGTSLDMVYDQLVFATTGLEDIAHTFVIDAMIWGIEPSVILFDYLVYTNEDDSLRSLVAGNRVGATRSAVASALTLTDSWDTKLLSETGLPSLSAPQTGNDASTSATAKSGPTGSSSASSQVAIIIGGSIAGAISILLAFIIAFFCIRRRRGQAAPGCEVRSSSSFFTTMLNKKNIPESAERGSIVSDARAIGSDIIDISPSVEASWSPSMTNMFSPLGSRRTDSITVVPPSSEVHRDRSVTPLGGEAGTETDAYPLGKDPFQRDVFDEKHERALARSRNSPNDGTIPAYWTSPVTPIRSRSRGPRDRSAPGTNSRTNANTNTSNTNSGSNEQILLEHIATLRAEVDRLQDRQSFGFDGPPPSYSIVGVDERPAPGSGTRSS